MSDCCFAKDREDIIVDEDFFYECTKLRETIILFMMHPIISFSYFLLIHQEFFLSDYIVLCYRSVYFLKVYDKEYLGYLYLVWNCRAHFKTA